MSNGQKDRILEGAESLFYKAGIRSVTMDEIARHLGMSKKTIYQYFKDKDEMVNALVAKKLEQDKDEMCSIGDKSSNVIEEMINMMKCSEEFLLRINPVVVHDLRKYHTQAWKQIQAFKADVVINIFQDILSRGMSQGYIRPDIDTKIIARMRILQVESGFDTEMFPPPEYNIWKVQLQFLEHFIYGVCTLKGCKILNQHKNIIEHE